jgi:hypothetical protein
MKKSAFFACLAAAFTVTFMGFSCGNPAGPSTTGTITVSAPVSGQKVCAGDTLVVTWDKSVSSPKISYNFNLGAGWQVFATVIPVDAHNAKAVLPTTSFSDSFQIKVEDNGGSNNPGTSAFFSIKYIVIESPVAGSTIHNGDTVTIRWKDTPAKLNSLRFMLSTDDGMFFGDMLPAAVSVSATSLVWIVGQETGADAPFNYPSTTCILKIRDYTADQLFDVTGTFSVAQ